MTRIGRLSIAFAAVAALACGGGDDRGDLAANNIPGDDSGAIGTAGDTQLSDADREFIDDVAIAGMAEVELGRLAAEKGQNAAVKRFGEMMVEDHTKAGDELKQIASRYNYTPPATLDEDHRELRDRLSGLQGAEFDREYMEAMVSGHEEVVDQLESRVDNASTANSYSSDAIGGNNTTAGAQGGADDQGRTGDENRPTAQRSDNPATMTVNQWAAQTLPTVQNHLKQAREVEERLEN